MIIQYNRTFSHSDVVINGGLDGKDLITAAQKTTAGAPDTTAGVYQVGCIVANIATGLVYVNIGTTAVPVWQTYQVQNQVFAGLVDTVGGAATEVFAIPGAVVGDVATVTIDEVGVTPRTIVSASITGADELTVVFSGDPAADHVIAVTVVNPS